MGHISETMTETAIREAIGKFVEDAKIHMDPNFTVLSGMFPAPMDILMQTVTLICWYYLMCRGSRLMKEESRILDNSDQFDLECDTVSVQVFQISQVYRQFMSILVFYQNVERSRTKRNCLEEAWQKTYRGSTG